MLLWLFVFFISIVVGSFINVVIYRLPLILNGAKNMGLCFPASHCTSCGRTLKKRHNIPLFSYLFYKGKCPWCGENIPFRYLLVELLTILLVMSGWCKFSFDCYLFIGFFIIVVFSVIAAFIDLETRTIPDVLTYPLLISGIIFNTGKGFVLFESVVYGVILVYLLFTLFAWIMEWICGERAIGGGDIKFFTAIAAWFGIDCMPFVIIVASLITLMAISIVRCIDNKGKILHRKVPFAPGISMSVLLYSLTVYANPFFDSKLDFILF